MKKDEDLIYQRIFESILEHKLLPGARLVEDELCDIFRVGRAAVRQVLHRLKYDGIITQKKNTSAIVATPSVSEIGHVFAARRTIESGIVSAACGRMSDDSKSLVNDLLDRESASYQANKRLDWIQLSGNFHMELLRMTGENPLLEEFLRNLIVRSSLAIAASDGSDHGLCGRQDHRQILLAISSGDHAQATELMSLHLSEMEARLTNCYNQKSNSLRDLLQYNTEKTS